MLRLCPVSLPIAIHTHTHFDTKLYLVPIKLQKLTKKVSQVNPDVQIFNAVEVGVVTKRLESNLLYLPLGNFQGENHQTLAF